MAISTLVTINQITNRDFKSLLNIFGLKQVITEPTRTTEASSNLIDLIITNRPENITNKVVFVNSITDHEMITCSRKINNIRYNPKTVECRNYTNYSPEKLRSNVGGLFVSEFIEFLISSKDISVSQRLKCSLDIFFPLGILQTNSVVAAVEVDLV